VAKRKQSKKKNSAQEPAVDAPMRIIGGSFRNKRIEYSGDSRTRPMKERVREAVFNLIGPSVKDKLSIDLFAGTGAMGLEAISRGAIRTICIERHVPTTKIIRNNAEALEAVDRCAIHAMSSFIWTKQSLSDVPLDHPWLVFFCPPYDFYVSRWEELSQQLETFLEAAPEDSILIVEFDAQFDESQLPQAESWDVRTYSPARVGILRV